MRPPTREEGRIIIWTTRRQTNAPKLLYGRFGTWDVSFRLFKELNELDYYDRLQSPGLWTRRAKESRRPTLLKLSERFFDWSSASHIFVTWTFGNISFHWGLSMDGTAEYKDGVFNGLLLISSNPLWSHSHRHTWSGQVRPHLVSYRYIKSLLFFDSPGSSINRSLNFKCRSVAYLRFSFNYSAIGFGWLIFRKVCLSRWLVVANRYSGSL